jgi:hypothetical protein
LSVSNLYLLYFCSLNLYLLILTHLIKSFLEFDLIFIIKILSKNRILIYHQRSNTSFSWRSQHTIAVNIIVSTSRIQYQQHHQYHSIPLITGTKYVY